VVRSGGTLVDAAATKRTLTRQLTAAGPVGSTLLLTVVVTLAGTGVARWTYARVAKRGSRPIDDES
jgi:hypothetical protein